MTIRTFRNFMKFAALAITVTLYGCGSDVNGTYKKEGNNKREITLSKEGRIFFPGGDVANYTVEGNSIVIGSAFGGAKGEVSGSKLVFPMKRGIVSGTLSGTWVKK